MDVITRNVSGPYGYQIWRSFTSSLRHFSFFIRKPINCTLIFVFSAFSNTRKTISILNVRACKQRRAHIIQRRAVAETVKPSLSGWWCCWMRHGDGRDKLCKALSPGRSGLDCTGRYLQQRTTTPGGIGRRGRTDETRSFWRGPAFVAAVVSLVDRDSKGG